MNHFINLVLLIAISPFCAGQDQSPLMISPPDADAVISYFQQCPESPDGKKMAFTIFYQPDSMGIVVKDLNSGELKTINKIKGQVRHTGAHPIWIDNESLIYGSPSEYVIYHHNIITGAIRQYPGGKISDYSLINKKLLFVNSNKNMGQVGVYTMDFSSNEGDCVVSLDDVATLKEEIGTINPLNYWRIDHPYWSPNGKKILFQIKTDKNKSTKKDDYIFYADEYGEHIHFIGRKPMHVQWWDNESVFGHDWQDKEDYYMRRYDLKGNLVEELSGPGCHGAVSPDRQWIVTESWYGSDPIRVFLYRKGKTNHEKLLFEQKAIVNGIEFWKVRSHVHPAFSRDGKKVYFNGQGADGKSKVWRYSL